MTRALTGANILLTLRDKIANEEADLLREFGLGPSASFYLHQHLEQLKQAGLINDH